MRHFPLPVAMLAACISLAACMEPGNNALNTDTLATEDATQPPAPILPAAPEFTATSSVAGLHAKTLAELPTPKHGTKFGDGNFCSFIAQKPQTAAGKNAEAKSWTVSSEVSLAGYTSVGIFSQGEQGTSGTCMVQDGNIAIYRGSQLMGIVYGDTPESGELAKIGGVLETQSPDRVRIGDFTPANYVSADILLSKNGFEVVPLATSETFCGLDVPSLYGKEVLQARALLAKSGWKPHAPREEGDEAPAGHLTHEPEISDCSGTGYGFCSGGYLHKSGAVMTFTTAGDQPASIVSYGISCPKQK